MTEWSARRRGPPLRPASGGEAAVLGTEVGLLGARGRLGGGDQRGAQPAVALAGAPGALPPAALVVARGEPRPRGEVGGRRELGHVGANFCHQQLRCPGDAGDGVQQRDDCLLVVGRARA